MYEKNISGRWKKLTYLKYIEIISSKVFKSSSYVTTYLPGMLCDSWNAAFRSLLFIMWKIWNDRFVILRMRTEEIDWQCFVIWRFSLFMISVLKDFLFGQTIPCTEGLNVPKTFNHPTHKKACFLCNLTWHSFKCLKITANHIQLSTYSTVFFLSYKF